MTYGQPPVPQPGPNFGGTPYPGGPGWVSQAAAPDWGFMAPLGPPSSRRLIAGVLALVAALLLIVGSFLTWASITEEFSEDLGGSDTLSAEVSLTISGMGSVDMDAAISGGTESMQDAIDEEFSASAQDEAEDDTGAPGIWTVIFGGLIAVGGAVLLSRRFPGVGAGLTVLGAVAAVISAIIFVADPVGAVVTGDIGDTGEANVAVGAGLWMVLVGAILALVAAAAMLGLTLAPGTFDGAPATGGAGPAGFGPQPGGFPPQQGGFPPQQGGFPPQQGGFPHQGGFPPQPGDYPQPGGFPPAAR